MSSVTSSAPLSLIWRGTWQASGVNSNGYQRYDCVTHAVTSPTARTDIYFAVTEIASGGAEPNPTSGQTTWKLLLEGGTIAASDGSIVYHDADGNNVLVQAAADRILEVVNGIPEFVQRDPAPVATFEGYKLPNSNPTRQIGTLNTFWISGDRVYGLGTMWEGFVSVETSPTHYDQRITPTPLLFTPRDEDAQVPIGKVFNTYRSMFAIGKDDKSKVYGMGLNAGKFGDGVNDITTFVYDHFQKIQYFEDNSINIEHIVVNHASGTVPLTIRAETPDASDTSGRNLVSIAYFIQEVVDVGGVDTGGNVYVSAYSGGTYTRGAGGATRDGTVQAITGFGEPIIGGFWVSGTTFFWGKRRVYALGSVVTTAGANATNLSTVTEIGSFDSDIVHLIPDFASTSLLTITLADGRAYWYNYKSPSNQRTTTLFEQLPVISGKLYRKVVSYSLATTTIAIMDDNSTYLIGRYLDNDTVRVATSLTEIEFPYDIEIQDAYFTLGSELIMITTDGDVIGNYRSRSVRSMIDNSNYRMDIDFDGNSMTLYTDPGWVGRATDVAFSYSNRAYAFSIQTEDGYIYNSNRLGDLVDENDFTISTLLLNTFRPVGVNFQAQMYYTSSTSLAPLAGSYRDADANAFTGLMSYSSAQTDFSIAVSGSMVQRPTLRSYQVT